MEEPLAPNEPAKVDHLQMEFGSSSSDMDELLSPSTASEDLSAPLSIDDGGFGSGSGSGLAHSRSSSGHRSSASTNKATLAIGGWEEEEEDLDNGSFDSAMDVIGEEFGMDSDIDDDAEICLDEDEVPHIPDLVSKSSPADSHSDVSKSVSSKEAPAPELEAAADELFASEHQKANERVRTFVDLYPSAHAKPSAATISEIDSQESVYEDAFESPSKPDSPKPAVDAPAEPSDAESAKAAIDDVVRSVSPQAPVASSPVEKNEVPMDEPAETPMDEPSDNAIVKPREEPEMELEDQKISVEADESLDKTVSSSEKSSSEKSLDPSGSYENEPQNVTASETPEMQPINAEAESSAAPSAVETMPVEQSSETMSEAVKDDVGASADAAIVPLEKENSACEQVEVSTPSRSPSSFSPPAPSTPVAHSARKAPSEARSGFNPPRSPFSSLPAGYRSAFPSTPLSAKSGGSQSPNSASRFRNVPRSTPNSESKKDPTAQESAPPTSKKVRFRQRYPVPPLITKPRPEDEIIKDNLYGEVDTALHLAQPKPDLQELLDAATGTSIARRSNACGALKVLTAQTKNQMVLVRTAGFLDALIFAANQEIQDDDSEMALDARTRAIVSLLHVSTPKDNRSIVLNHPGLADCLVKCIAEDIGEARAAACGAVAMLAKSASCRESLVKVQYLVDVLAEIMIGKEEDDPLDCETSTKVDYCGDDEASRSRVRSFSSDSSDSASTNNSETSHIITKVSKALDVMPTFDSIRVKKQKLEDETKRRSRVNSCAALLHLSKHCSISKTLCQNETLLDSLIAVAREFDNPIHTKCLEIVCNLTRFPWNNSYLAKYPGLVDILVVGGRAKLDLDRVWSMRAFQNLSADAAGKTVLANSVVLELLSVCVMRKIYDEQVAAVAALFNLSTEPGAVVPLTNTKNVVATLVHVAHDPTSAADVRLMACDSLATLGLWLQTLAGAGTVPADVQQVPLPSYATTGWRRWDL